MNRERAKELLPIIQAFAEGKAIQFAKEGEMWIDLPDNENLILTFPADDYDYRIKPEPRVFWINPNDKSQSPRTGCWMTQEEYDQEEYETDKFTTKGYIKVREVIE